jgi:hypothetical protein
MADGWFHRNESRNSPRFVPQENLSIFLANDKVSLVRGDVKDLSEVGARVLTHAVLDRGEVVTIDVRSGYSYLFRAEAKIVWRTDVEFRRDSRLCVHGIFFTALSPFSRKLIQRLGGLVPGGEGSPRSSAVEKATWGADSDGDLDALFPLSGSEDDVFDLLSDPVFERPLFDEAAGTSSSDHESGPGATIHGERARDGLGLLDFTEGSPRLEADRRSWLEAIRAWDLTAAEADVVESRRYIADGAELSGNLGYFNNTDVLQMLESARATGVLYVEGEYTGQIHLRDGRICGCFSKSLDEYEAAFRLIVADRGCFRFIPSAVRSNLLTSRTTTQLLLEAQLRQDNDR